MSKYTNSSAPTSGPWHTLCPLPGIPFPQIIARLLTSLASGHSPYASRCLFSDCLLVHLSHIWEPPEGRGQVCLSITGTQCLAHSLPSGLSATCKHVCTDCVAQPQQPCAPLYHQTHLEPGSLQNHYCLLSATGHCGPSSECRVATLRAALCTAGDPAFSTPAAAETPTPPAGPRAEWPSVCGHQYAGPVLSLFQPGGSRGK